MRFFCTLAFSSPLRAPELYARLRERVPWNWRDREGDRWGEYLSCTGFGGEATANMSILVDEPEHGRCALNLTYRSSSADAQRVFEKLRGLVLDRILPAMEAHSIAEVDFLER